MGRLFLEYLEGKVYACSTCGSHLASATELVSKVDFRSEDRTLDLRPRLTAIRLGIADGLSLAQSFHSKNGKAYLFNLVVNVCQGPKEERLMTTGLHHVADLQCTNCKQLVGWKYVSIFFAILCCATLGYPVDPVSACAWNLVIAVEGGRPTPSLG